MVRRRIIRCFSKIGLMRSRALVHRVLPVLLLHCGLAVYCDAAVLDGNPSSYRTLLRKLQPGDTLRLAPGRYVRLQIANLNGAEDAWITITGPASGTPAEIVKQSPEEIARMKTRPTWGRLVASIAVHPRQMRALSTYRFDAGTT